MSNLVVPIIHRCVPPAQSTLPTSSNNISVRATTALGGFALGLVNWTKIAPEDPELAEAKDKISGVVAQFFELPSASASLPSPTMLAKGKMVKPRAVSEPLRDALFAALSACEDGDPPDVVTSPQWATSMVTALTVMLGGGAFSSPHGIRTMLECLSFAHEKQAKAQVRQLGRLWWPAAIWAAAQLDEKDEAWDRVSKLRMPPHSTCLVAILLNAPDGDREKRLFKALMFIKKMISETQTSAVHLLARIVAEVSKEEREASWSPLNLICRQLLDGSILHTEWKTLSATCEDALKNKTIAGLLEGEVDGAGGTFPTIDDIKPLSVVEIRGWIDPLLDVWKTILKKVSFGTKDQGAGGAAPVSPLI